MRILHVLDHSLPLHSGYTFRTAAILREQQALGWETIQLTSPKQGPSPAEVEQVAGLQFFRSPPAGSRWPLVNETLQMRALGARLLALASELRPDVIHAHSPVLNVLPALRVGRRLGIPVTYEIRAFWEDAAVDHGTTREGSLRYRVTRALETWALQRVAHAFTICEGLRGDIVARGIKASSVSVIPNAVDIDGFQLSRGADPGLRGELGLTEGETIGFVGSFYAYEGLDLLIDVLPALLAQRPRLRCLLVGGGPQEAALRTRARALGVEHAVIFTGRVPHEQVSRYYDQIDLLIYPRHSMRLTELVTPLKPLEAMAQGRLLVASDVGGHRELIRDGETGQLFRAGSPQDLIAAIESMLEGTGRWPAMRAAGRQFVETERNWKASVARYRDVFAQVVRCSANPSAMPVEGVRP